MDRKSSSTDAVLDADSALKRLGGDEDLFADLLSFFVEDAPSLMSDLRAGLAASDAAATRKAAHALKGLVLGCGGVRAARVAHSVEGAAEVKNLEAAESFANSLAGEIQTLNEAVADYRK
jgi:HPt (histidine-containing phosphotransfer) domain-containing protein